jgi:hypothetical protein
MASGGRREIFALESTPNTFRALGIAACAAGLLACGSTDGRGPERSAVHPLIPDAGDVLADAGPDGAAADATSTPDGAGDGDGSGDGPPGLPLDASPTAPESGWDGGPSCAAFDAGSAPVGAAVCGDGWRDPATEECDDGLGASPAARRGCSASCQVLDELGVWQTSPDGGLANADRTLATGRHPLAAGDTTLGAVYLQPGGGSPTMALATFSPRGDATGTVVPFGASGVVDDSAPVVAALPCGKYAVSWADFDSAGGDELDVALALVDPSGPSVGATSYANANTSFSQFDPDIVWTGTELVVAWVDDSNAATAPDLRVRTFDANLVPTSGEQTLAATADSEADVALAPFGGSWAAAWRDDAAGLETIAVTSGGAAWTVGPAFLAPASPAKPALTALDAAHLLVVYAAGVEDDSGAAAPQQLFAAVLGVSAPGAVTGTPVPLFATSGLAAGAPAATTVQGTAYVGWWTAGAPGDANGEELWLKNVGWDGMALDLSAVEAPLPRWAQARHGDQESPAFAASALPPGGALAAAWTDLGRALATGEGTSDVVFEFAPTPLLREAGEGGGP